VIVICDTNVFVRETHLLRKKGGPTLLQFLRAIQGRLFVPEILQREYVEQTLAAVNEERTKAENALSALRTLVGRRQGHPLPEDDAVEQGSIARLRELETLTMTAPLSEAILAAAGTRSLEKRPPTSKSDHGYKDCLIWEFIIRLPPGSEVRLISRDKKAFFDSGDQFSKVLTEEVRERQINLVAYQSLEPLLHELQTRNPLLDLAALEASEVIDEPADAGTLSATAASAPIPRAETSVLADDDATAADTRELKSQLAQAQQTFENLDLRILGFIAHFGTPGKEQLFNLLVQADVPMDEARNVIDRLIITRFVRDTGNHYLVADRRLGDIAAATVEEEIIALLTKEPLGNG
jgi:PIN domain